QLYYIYNSTVYRSSRQGATDRNHGSDRLAETRQPPANVPLQTTSPQLTVPSLETDRDSLGLSPHHPVRKNQNTPPPLSGNQISTQPTKHNPINNQINGKLRKRDGLDITDFDPFNSGQICFTSVDPDLPKPLVEGLLVPPPPPGSASRTSSTASRPSSSPGALAAHPRSAAVRHRVRRRDRHREGRGIFPAPLDPVVARRARRCLPSLLLAAARRPLSPSSLLVAARRPLLPMEIEEGWGSRE
ncbi:hypothetical protein Dimus_015980, partial [Dionaea muscipula]